jgi:hypothetical protein
MSVVIDGATGVTAPAFDGAVDAADLTGNLPALNGSALTNLPAPTSAQVGTATAGLAVGAVGTYAFLAHPVFAVVTAGSTIAGSSLVYSTVQGFNTNSLGTDAATSTSPAGGVPSGTWRAMGANQNSGGAAVTLFLRIS